MGTMMRLWLVGSLDLDQVVMSCMDRQKISPGLPLTYSILETGQGLFVIELCGSHLELDMFGVMKSVV